MLVAMMPLPCFWREAAIGCRDDRKKAEHLRVR